MICPHCHREATSRVIVTEVVSNGRRRRRVCDLCAARFTTIETMRGLRRVREVVEFSGAEGDL